MAHRCVHIHLHRHRASRTAQHVVQQRLLDCSLFPFVLRKSERDSGREMLVTDWGGVFENGPECPDLPSFESTSLGSRTCSTLWQVSWGSLCVCVYTQFPATCTEIKQQQCDSHARTPGRSAGAHSTSSFGSMSNSPRTRVPSLLCLASPTHPHPHTKPNTALNVCKPS